MGRTASIERGVAKVDHTRVAPDGAEAREYFQGLLQVGLQTARAYCGMEPSR